jgi:hypothetical protein
VDPSPPTSDVPGQHSSPLGTLEKEATSDRYTGSGQPARSKDFRKKGSLVDGYAHCRMVAGVFDLAPSRNARSLYRESLARRRSSFSHHRSGDLRFEWPTALSDFARSPERSIHRLATRHGPNRKPVRRWLFPSRTDHRAHATRNAPSPTWLQHAPLDHVPLRAGIRISVEPVSAPQRRW